MHGIMALAAWQWWDEDPAKTWSQDDRVVHFGSGLHSGAAGAIHSCEEGHGHCRSPRGCSGQDQQSHGA